MQSKTAQLLLNSNGIFQFAVKNYKTYGRGAVFVRFDNEEQLLQLKKRIIVFYAPLEMVGDLEYEELPRQVRVYHPAIEFVLLVCVATSLVKDGELMQASTARPSLPVELIPPITGPDQPWSSLNIASSMEFCAHCYVAEPKFKCARCSAAQYCSKTCQRAHWQEAHKKGCDRREAGEAKA